MKLNFFDYTLNDADDKRLLQEAKELASQKELIDCVDADICQYNYETKKASEALGLEKELIEELLSDYITQIVKAVLEFEVYLAAENLEAFHELAHKNLGVARNLRIENTQQILFKMMHSNDMKILHKCLEMLKICTVFLDARQTLQSLKSLRTSDL